MAIDNFKKIEENKGYLVDEKDRKIFEREISKGYFGVDTGDIIEFIIYDSSDNQLPQASVEGKNVRYIEYNDNTEKKYFGKVQKNKSNIKTNDSEEFFIDVEKLIKEAGYSNGIFKTQVSLLNRRLGSTGVNDNTWIHEISPSRTEIRILPTVDENGKPNPDLEARYQCFLDGKIFRGDVLPFIDEFVNQFDVQKALENMLTLKGTVDEGQHYVGLIKEEFKVESFDLMVQQIKDKFIQAVGYYKSDRDYNITSNRYGQPLQTEIKLCYSDNEIYDDIVNIINECIEFYLPKRDIRRDNSLTIEQQETLDELRDIEKTIQGTEKYKSTRPESVDTPTVGCKNPKAANYNEFADIHDESLCVFVEDIQKDDPPPPPPPPKPIICNDPRAINYGEEGECIYPIPEDKKPKEINLSDRPNVTSTDPRVQEAQAGNTGIGAGALGGVQLDLDDPNEKALYDIVTDTYDQVNEEATRLFFEEQNNAGMERGGLDASTSTQAGSGGQANISAEEFDNMSASDRINTGRASSVVIDKKVKDRQVNQI